MKRDAVMAMTDEELRKKCLRLCGWHSTTDQSTWSPTDGDPPHMYYEDTPDYPRCIYSAMLLWDAWRGAHVRYFRLQCDPASNSDMPWQCAFSRDEIGRELVHGRADTAARAITRAFILATQEG